MPTNPHNYLRKTDPILGKVITRGRLPDRRANTNHFRSLVESITSQQLSVKASDTIFQRFRKLFPGKAFPTPAMVLKMPDRKLRACGLSNSKVAFIKDLARKIETKEVNLRQLSKWENEEIILHLTKVKGIGRWTAEMFLMFSLQRPDVFSHGDLGLRNAIQKLYGFKKPPTPKQIEKIVQKWSPYKTLASRYLWRSLSE